MKNQFIAIGLAFGLSSSLSLAQTKPAAPAGGAIEANRAAAPAAKALKDGAQFGEAKLEAKSGSKAAGTVTFTKEKDGIRVTANVTGVSVGKHGFHIHERGDCSAPDASSAGGHFNPGGAGHGDPKSKDRHAGDMGNIDINKDGKGSLTLKVSDPKAFSAWSEIGGKAVILHEKADDLKTQPTGDAGGRIACGVIELSPSTSH